MDWVLGVASGLVVATVLGLLGWFFTPLGNHLRRVRTKLTNDHGIAVRVYTTPDEMRDLSTEELLGTDPRYLAGQNFYLRHNSPKAPMDDEEWWLWAQRLGGEDVYASHILVLLQATLDRSVAVRPPRVKWRALVLPRGSSAAPRGRAAMASLFAASTSIWTPRARPPVSWTLTIKSAMGRLFSCLRVRQSAS
jgi:hypothetical protein